MLPLRVIQIPNCLSIFCDGRLKISMQRTPLAQTGHTPPPLASGLSEMGSGLPLGGLCAALRPLGRLWDSSGMALCSISSTNVAPAPLKELWQGSGKVSHGKSLLQKHGISQRSPRGIILLCSCLMGSGWCPRLVSVTLRPNSPAPLQPFVHKLHMRMQRWRRRRSWSICV